MNRKYKMRSKNGTRNGYPDACSFSFYADVRALYIPIISSSKCKHLLINQSHITKSQNNNISYFCILKLMRKSKKQNQTHWKLTTQQILYIA